MIVFRVPVQGVTLVAVECIEVWEVVEVDDPSARVFTPKSVASFDCIHVEWTTAFVKVNMTAFVVSMIGIIEVSKFLHGYEVGSRSVLIVVANAIIDCRFKIFRTFTLPIPKLKL